jgi:exopolysaccharide biosynthesis polyprenyl glycosylphosphotransferase
MGRNVERSLKSIRIALDLVVLVVAHFVAWQLRFKTGLPGLRAEPLAGGPYAIASVISIGVFFSLLAVNRLHDEDTIFRGGREVSRVVRAAAQTMILFPALAFLSHTRTISRSWVVLAVGLATALIVGVRLLTRAVVTQQRKHGQLRRPVIVIGNGHPFESKGSNEFEVVGAYDAAEGIEFLASLAEGSDKRARAGRSLGVIVSEPGIEDDVLWRILLHAGEVGCRVFIEAGIRSVAPDRLTVRSFKGRTVMRVSPPALTGWQAFRKRVFDLVVSALTLVVLSPVLALIALAVVVTSGRPLLYRQERVGRNGKRFDILKFRTMRADAEAASGPVWAQQDDPRRTPLGRILRASSIDELPQLWNVLKGQMSLVGPRPERSAFVEEFLETIPSYPYRHRMRPGMTGWAQAHGLRGNTPLDKRVAYDNWYIEHWSLGLDVKICVLTALEVVRGEHAY